MVPERTAVTSDRRTVLRALAGVGPLSVAGCAESSGADPAIAVPESALVDEPVRVELTGLEPGATVRLRARATARDGTEWESHATFEADDGTVAVPEQAPVDGTYERADGMGPFWSMRPANADPDERVPPGTLFAPPEGAYDVALTATVGGETVARRRRRDGCSTPTSSDRRFRPRTWPGGSTRPRATTPHLA